MTEVWIEKVRPDDVAGTQRDSSQQGHRLELGSGDWPRSSPGSEYLTNPENRSTLSVVGLVMVTVVHDELEAEVVCGLLRTNGIECAYRPSAAGSAVWGMTPAVGGPTEIFVDEADLERAQELLESDETDPGALSDEPDS